MIGQHRAILDSDIIHLRRPDARDWDGWLHVNPQLAECAFGIFYNPLIEPIERRIRLPLYYSGLTRDAVILRENGAIETVHLERNYSAELNVTIPARGRTWVSLRSAN